MVEARRYSAVGAGCENCIAVAVRLPATPGDIMNYRTTIAGLTFGVLLLSSFAVAGPVPVRGASKNGVNSSQPQMNLFGPTQPQSASGGDVGIATQVVCPNQDVAGASAADGS